MTEETSLARIPFSPEIEKKIVNQAFWMRFIAIIHYIAAAFCALGLIGVMISGGEWPISLPVMITGIMLMGGILAYQGHSLSEASGLFKLVATTDEADQAYVAEGLEKTKVFFMLEGVFTGLAFVLGIAFTSAGLL